MLTAMNFVHRLTKKFTKPNTGDFLVKYIIQLQMQEINCIFNTIQLQLQWIRCLFHGLPDYIMKHNHDIHLYLQHCPEHMANWR